MGGLSTYTRVLAELTISAGKELLEKTGPALIRLKKLAGKGATLRSGAQIVSLISTAGILSTIKDNPEFAYFASAVTFISGLFSLLADRVIALVDPRAGTAETLFTKLSEANSKFQILVRTLEAAGQVAGDADEKIVTDIITQTNAVAAEINVFIDQVF
jgi:hypothetical protein